MHCLNHFHLMPQHFLRKFQILNRLPQGIPCKPLMNQCTFCSSTIQILLITKRPRIGYYASKEKGLWVNNGSVCASGFLGVLFPPGECCLLGACLTIGPWFLLLHWVFGADASDVMNDNQQCCFRQWGWGVSDQAAHDINIQLTWRLDWPIQLRGVTGRRTFVFIWERWGCQERSTGILGSWIHIILLWKIQIHTVSSTSSTLWSNGRHRRLLSDLESLWVTECATKISKLGKL